MLPMLTVPVAFQILGIFAGSILFFIACGKGIGNGSAGSSGTRPAFTSTQIIDATGDGTGNTLSVPYGIAVDSTSGDVYVTGFLSDNAFQITPAPGGTITEIIDVLGDRSGDGSCSGGDIPITRNPLCEAHGVTVDPASGNVMVTGFLSFNVFEIEPGACSTGGGTKCPIKEIIEEKSVSGVDRLRGPYDVDLDSSGNLYVSSASRNNAFKIDTPGGSCSTTDTPCTTTEIIDSEGDEAGSALIVPHGVAVDSLTGDIYITSSGAGGARVFRIEEGALIHLTAAMDGPSANAGAGTGSLGVGTAIIDFDTTTKVLNWSITWSGLTGTPTAMHFHGPATPLQSAGVQVGTEIAGPPEIGNAVLSAAQEADLLAGLYYLNLHTSEDPGGEIRGQVLPVQCSSSTVGGMVVHPCHITVIMDGTGDGTGNLFADPHDIAVDSSGNVYVTGSTTHNAFKIDTPGTCSTTGTPCTITQIIDASGDGTSPLNFARGIAVDANFNVYVAGSVSHNVFWITPDGVITEIINVEGDGTNSLTIPHDLAVKELVGGGGDVYVYVTGAGSNNVFQIAVP